MDRGYIKTWRCCQDNDLYFSEPFTKYMAWQDLLLLANYADGVMHKRGVEIEIKRGCLAWSVKGLADRWCWSMTKVNNFLKLLAKKRQIEYQKNNVTTLITILNYEVYQEKETKKKPKRNQKETSKEGKEGKEVKHKHGEYKNVLLTDKELEKLKVKFNGSFADKIKAMDEGEEMKGYNYKSHYTAILNWARRDSDSGAGDETTSEKRARMQQ